MGKYDKIIKESLSQIIVPLAKCVNLNLERIAIIKDKVQYTIEREPDFLAIVLHDDPKDNYISHIEFQSENDDTMPQREHLMGAIIEYVHKLEVRQIVFYFGEEPLTMLDYIQKKNLYFKYELYDMRGFKSLTFLKSSIPEAVLLALFCNYEDKQASEIIDLIVQRLRELVKNKLKFQKIIFQLRVLSGLRNLQGLLNKKLNNMPITFEFDVTQDLFFQKGEERGVEKGIEKGIEKDKMLMVEKFLLRKLLSIAEIADFVEVSESFVKSIRERLIKEGRLKS